MRQREHTWSEDRGNIAYLESIACVLCHPSEKSNIWLSYLLSRQQQRQEQTAVQGTFWERWTLWGWQFVQGRTKRGVWEGRQQFHEKQGAQAGFRGAGCSSCTAELCPNTSLPWRLHSTCQSWIQCPSPRAVWALKMDEEQGKTSLGMPSCTREMSGALHWPFRGPLGMTLLTSIKFTT